MMRKFYRLLVVPVLLLAVCSCQKDDYANSIPRNASLVASLNIGNIYEKSDFQHTSVFGASNLYTGMFFDKVGAKKAQEYLKDPALYGVDFRKPVYVFCAGDYFGVAMDLHSEKKFVEFVELLRSQNICTKVTEKDDAKTCVLLDEVAVAFNSRSLLFLASMGEGSVSSTRQLAVQMLSQKEELSFTSTEQFEQLAAMQDKDIALFGNLNMLPKDVVDVYLPSKPKSVKNSDIQLMSSLDFSDGMAELTADVMGASEEAKEFLKKSEENFRKIEGRYVGSPTEDCGVWATMGINGKWLVENLKKSASTKPIMMMAERAVDIEQMFAAIDGDLTVTLPANMEVMEGQPYPDFMMTAKVSNTAFLEDVDYWTKSMKDYGANMTRNGKNDYFITAADYAFYWGVDADNLYMASEQAFKHNAVTRRSNMLVGLEDEIRQNCLFVYFNLQAMPLKSWRSVTLFGGNVHKMKSLIIKAPNTQEITFRLELKDKSQNFLKTML